MRAVLGNRAAVVVHVDDAGARTVEKLPRGKRATVVDAPDGTSMVELFTAITAANGVWDNHAHRPPVWVASDSPGLASLLAEHYGCETRQLEEVR